MSSELLYCIYGFIITVDFDIFVFAVIFLGLTTIYFNKQSYSITETILSSLTVSGYSNDNV